MGVGCVTALPIKEVGQPHQGLGIQDLLSFGPSGKAAHSLPLGPCSST